MNEPDVDSQDHECDQGYLWEGPNTARPCPICKPPGNPKDSPEQRKQQEEQRWRGRKPYYQQDNP